MSNESIRCTYGFDLHGSEQLQKSKPHTPDQTAAPPSFLTAHGRFYLVLLCSQPDTVHRHPLRKTQTSSPLIKGCYTNADPPPSITPTIADCRYKAPLTPRLHGHFILPFLYTKVKHYDFSNIWIANFLLLY